MYHIELTDEEGRIWNEEGSAASATLKGRIISRARKLSAQTRCDVEIIYDGEILDIVSLHAHAPCPRCGEYSCREHHPLCYSAMDDDLLGDELAPEGKTIT